MRVPFLTLLLLLLMASEVPAAWLTIPTPGNARLNDIHILQSQGSNAFLVAGDGGVLLRTVDGGTNWTQPLTGVTADLHRVHDMSSSQYYVSGAAGVLYGATDAALTWSNLSLASTARLIVIGGSSGNPQLVGSDGSYRRDSDDDARHL